MYKTYNMFKEIGKALVAVKRVYKKGERGKQAPDCNIL